MTESPLTQSFVFQSSRLVSHFADIPKTCVITTGPNFVFADPRHSEMIAFARHIAVLGTHGALFFVDYMTNRWFY